MALEQNCAVTLEKKLDMDTSKVFFEIEKRVRSCKSLKGSISGFYLLSHLDFKYLKKKYSIKDYEDFFCVIAKKLEKMEFNFHGKKQLYFADIVYRRGEIEYIVSEYFAYEMFKIGQDIF